MSVRITNADLQAYLDEALPGDRMAAVEQAIREDEDLGRSLAAIIARREAGMHSLGEIWRRHRISCPPREQIGSYLLGVLSDGEATYIKFHLETIGCRVCLANCEDLRRTQGESLKATSQRRDRFFKSTAGRLKGE